MNRSNEDTSSLLEYKKYFKGFVFVFHLFFRGRGEKCGRKWKAKKNKVWSVVRVIRVQDV